MEPTNNNMPTEGIIKETTITSIQESVSAINSAINSSMAKAITINSQISRVKELTACCSNLLQSYDKVTINVPKMEIKAVTELKKTIIQKMN